MPTLVYCDGFEDRSTSINDFGAANTGEGIFDALSGTPTIITTGQRTGNAALQCVNSGARTSALKYHPGTDPTVSVISIYIKFTALPTATENIFNFGSGTGAALYYNFSSGKFALGWAAPSSGGDIGPVLVTGTEYLVDLRLNVSANPNLFDGQVDGGTNVQVSNAVAASTVFWWWIGGDSGTPTFTVQFDDFVASVTSADYPIGAHKVLGLFPNGDGTHSFTPAGDFLRTATSMDPSDTNGWLEIDDLITGAADTTTYIADALGSSTEYTEFTFDDTTETTIWVVTAVAAMMSAAAAANNITCKIVDSGGTDVMTIYSGDASETVLHFRTVSSAANPTQTAVNGWKLRWGLGTDVNPDPWLSAAMLQIAVPEAPAVVPTNPWVEMAEHVAEAAYWG